MINNKLLYLYYHVMKYSELCSVIKAIRMILYFHPVMQDYLLYVPRVAIMLISRNNRLI